MVKKHFCIDCKKGVRRRSTRCKTCSNIFRAIRPVREFGCEICGALITTRNISTRFCSNACASKNRVSRMTEDDRKQRGERLRNWHIEMVSQGRNVNQERWDSEDKTGWKAKHRAILLEMHNTPEYKKDRSEKQTGENNFWHKMSPETLERLKVERSIRQTEKMSDIDYKERIMQKTRLANEIKPTKPEIQLDQILRQLNLYFLYSGDGTRWIGAKNPDFINYRDYQVIEMFGCYWHDCQECKGNFLDVFAEDERTLHFAKYGYDTLVIWEHELKDLDKLQGKILSFVS